MEQTSLSAQQLRIIGRYLTNLHKAQQLKRVPKNNER